MGRKPSTTLDYISLDVTDKTTLKRLHRKFGKDGRLFWYELLRLLGRTENYFLDLSDKWDLEDIIEEELFVDKEIGVQIIQQLCLWGNLDADLWQKCNIIWCQALIDRHDDVWNKRTKKPTKPIISVTEKTISGTETNINSTESTQSKVKESKVKEKKSKVNNILLSEIEISDLEEEQKQYFEIAVAFQQLFIKNLQENQAPTKHQEEAKYKSYVDPIRLMMENDGISKEQLTKVFKFLDSPGGDFWKPNILSTSKLRQQFQQLILKANQNNANRNNNNQKSDSELKQSASNAVDKMFSRQQ